MNPETGEFIRNPDAADSRRNKLIQDTIDNLIKDDENEAKVLEAEAKRLQAQGKHEESLAVRREAERGRDERAREMRELREILADNAEKGRDRRYKPESASERRFKVENKTNLNQAQAALQSVMDNPDAFGKKTYLPSDVTQRLPWKGYGDEASIKARAAIANIVSMEIKMRSGAAVTAAEMPRLKPFLPVDGDTPETVIWKMEQLITEYERILREIDAGPDAFSESEIMGRPKPATGGGDEGWSFEDN